MSWRVVVICRESGNDSEYYCVGSEGLERAVERDIVEDFTFIVPCIIVIL